MTKLLECPFCGIDAELLINTVSFEFDTYKIICKNNKCMIQTPLYPNEKEAIDAWNTRKIK